MKLLVRVKPGAKTTKVERLNVAEFMVSLKEPARKGKANRALIRALAEYFDIPQAKIEILTGHVNRRKTIAIND